MNTPANNTNPRQAPSHGGNGGSTLYPDIFIGIIVGSAVAVAQKIFQFSDDEKRRREHESAKKRMEEMEKSIKRIEQQKVASAQKRMEEMEKSIKKIEQTVKVAADVDDSHHLPPPPKGQTYVKCKDVETFMNFCLQYNGYREDKRLCEDYIKAWSSCQKKTDVIKN